MADPVPFGRTSKVDGLRRGFMFPGTAVRERKATT